MPSTRTLNINVNVSATQGGNGSYSVTSVGYVQQPSTPPMDGVVGSDGDIDLTNLLNHTGFVWALNMVYTLIPTVTDQNGQSVECTWATNPAQACVITGPPFGPSGGMTLGPLTATELTIVNANDDRTKTEPDERTYTYKLSVILPTVPNSLMSLDPKIVNTGPIGSLP